MLRNSMRRYHVEAPAHLLLIRLLIGYSGGDKRIAALCRHLSNVPVDDDGVVFVVSEHRVMGGVETQETA